MNNSFLANQRVKLSLEATEDISSALAEREAKLIKLIEALKSVDASNEWSSLKKEIFDGIAENLAKDIQTEAKRMNPDTNKLNRLTGELIWAERYADLQKLAETFRVELSQVRIRLYGTRKSGSEEGTTP